ncbi:MAG: hypothetical protein K8S18_09100 [Desulfobacula sp.]|nr:hypothetical protein [Desulfobacula sp.]
MNEWNIKELVESIKELRRTAIELKQRGMGIQTIERNVDRILADVTLLELNVSDIEEFL